MSIDRKPNLFWGEILYSIDFGKMVFVLINCCFIINFYILQIIFNLDSYKNMAPFGFVENHRLYRVSGNEKQKLE